QAEDGIRDFHVTGVQTCALPIFRSGQTARSRGRSPRLARRMLRRTWSALPLILALALVVRIAVIVATPHFRPIFDAHDYDRHARSEERRVGKARGPGATRPSGSE